MKLRSSVYGWKSVWMDVADEMNGTYSEEKDVFTMQLPLDSLTSTFRMQHGRGDKTTVLLPYVSNSDFTFAIHNRNWMEEAAKPFGAQDIVVGFEAFDHAYIIKGNNEKLVKEFFADEKVRTMIEGQKSVKLELHTSGNVAGKALPHGVHAITFEDRSAINSFERLVSITELMKAILARLVAMKAAELDDPGFQF